MNYENLLLGYADSHRGSDEIDRECTSGYINCLKTVLFRRTQRNKIQ